MTVLRIAAFSNGTEGGNPAGVWIGAALPEPEVMQRIAAEVGYSETAFAAPIDGGWTVRYFAPQAEVAFCGHATIALGAALAEREGEGVFKLALRDADITVEGRRDGVLWAAALQSPPTESHPAHAKLTAEVLALFGLDEDDLDARIPPAEIHAGADHFVLALKSRATLAAMEYDFEDGEELMRELGWITILLVHAETPQLFHTRNAFAAGGLLEDPATGASTAAFAGYLRDLGWPHGGAIDVVQGEDMGVKCLLHADITSEPGASIRVSGTARVMTQG